MAPILSRLISGTGGGSIGGTRRRTGDRVFSVTGGTITAAGITPGNGY
jgi:hypothetical protein